MHPTGVIILLFTPSNGIIWLHICDEIMTPIRYAAVIKSKCSKVFRTCLLVTTAYSKMIMYTNYYQAKLVRKWIEIHGANRLLGRHNPLQFHRNLWHCIKTIIVMKSLRIKKRKVERSSEPGFTLWLWRPKSFVTLWTACQDVAMQWLREMDIAQYTGCFTIVETKRQLLKPLSMTLFIFLFPDCHREIVNLSI